MGFDSSPFFFFQKFWKFSEAKTELKSFCEFSVIYSIRKGTSKKVLKYNTL